MSTTPADCPGPETEYAGRNITCDGCPNQQACISGNPFATGKIDEKLDKLLKSVSRRILILSGKGGVGKSTVCALVSLALSEWFNIRVGCIDGDLCGPNLPLLMNAHNESIHRVNVDGQNKLVPVYVTENLSLISSAFLMKSKNDALIWRGPRKNGLLLQFIRDVQWFDEDEEAIECLISDFPPGTSDEHISLYNYLKPNGVILVTSRHVLSTQDVRRQISFCRRLNLKILAIVENMSYVNCPNCHHNNELFKTRQGIDDVQSLVDLCNEYQNLRPIIIRLPASLLLQHPLDFIQKNQKETRAEENSEICTSIESVCDVILNEIL